MELVLIADVGGAQTYHVGDEAMLEANLGELSRRLPGTRFTVVSADPEATARRYRVEAVAPLGFPSGDAEQDEVRRERRLEEVLRRAEGADADAPPPAAEPAVVAAVRRSSAVVVSGGGNLNSSWPEHIYERVALLELARRFGKRRIVLGQTLGPELRTRERELVHEVLANAHFVGVRETYSLRYAQALAVPESVLELQLDDAWILEPRAAEAAGGPSRPWIGITLTSGIRPLAAATEQLRMLSRALDVDLVFLPHVRGAHDDERVARELERAFGGDGRLSVRDVEAAETARRRISGASMVISSRYHPLVFALAAGVPALGVHLDEYTRIKLVGALGHAGLGEWTLPWALAREGALLAAARELWARRRAVRREIDHHRERWRSMQAAHWDRVVATLSGDGGAITQPGVPEPRGDAQVEPGDAEARPSERWARLNAHLRSTADRAAAERLNLLHQRDEAVRYANSLRGVLAARDDEIAGLRRALEPPPGATPERDERG